MYMPVYVVRAPCQHQAQNRNSSVCVRLVYYIIYFFCRFFACINHPKSTQTARMYFAINSRSMCTRMWTNLFLFENTYSFGSYGMLISSSYHHFQVIICCTQKKKKNPNIVDFSSMYYTIYKIADRQSLKYILMWKSKTEWAISCV